MSDKKPFLKFDLSIFENNGRKDFAEVIRKNKVKTAETFLLFVHGLKNEASDSKETSRIIFNYVSKQQISKEEEKHLKTQVYNIFKILGVGIPFVLIPGASVLIPFILKAAEKKGIDLYPSNFKRKTS